MTVEVNLDNHDDKIFGEFADKSNRKIPVLAMQSVVTTVLNDLEDEKDCIKAMEEYEKDPVSYPIAEVWARLGLE